MVRTVQIIFKNRFNELKFMADQTKKAKNVKAKYEDHWLSLTGVSAVGVGLTKNEEVGIIVSVSVDPQKLRNHIPRVIDGISVEIKETGEFEAQ